ncbi:MAG: DUF937 domain-containing protein [Mastigocoleus sp.]
MGLFDQIMGAVANPNTQGSMDQIGTILNTVQQLSNNTGTNSSTMQSAMGIVGNFVRSSLQQKQANQGAGTVEALVNQFGGTAPNAEAVDSVLSGAEQQQVSQEVSQRTGLDLGVVQGMLPMLVPMVLNLLKTGSSSQGGGNSVLNSFLDQDGDGDVDMADMMQMASRHLGQ